MTLAIALAFAAATFVTIRDAQAARIHAAEAAALARDHGFHLVFAWALIYEGRALADGGRAAEGLVLMREGLAAARMIGGPLFQAFQLALVAEVQCGEGLLGKLLADTGRPAEARELLRTALGRVSGDPPDALAARPLLDCVATPDQRCAAPAKRAGEKDYRARP